MSACLKVTFPKWSEVVKIAVLKAAFTLSPMYFRPLSQHHWWKWEIGKSQEVRLGPSFIHVSENKPSYFQPSAIRGSCRPHKVKLTYHLQKPSQKHLLARALYTVCICIYIYISIHYIYISVLKIYIYIYITLFFAISDGYSLVKHSHSNMYRPWSLVLLIPGGWASSEIPELPEMHLRHSMPCPAVPKLDIMWRVILL